MKYFYKGYFDKEYQEVTFEELLSKWHHAEGNVFALNNFDENEMYFSDEEWQI